LIDWLADSLIDWVKKLFFQCFAVVLAKERAYGCKKIHCMNSLPDVAWSEIIK